MSLTGTIKTYEPIIIKTGSRVLLRDLGQVDTVNITVEPGAQLLLQTEHASAHNAEFHLTVQESATVEHNLSLVSGIYNLTYKLVGSGAQVLVRGVSQVSLGETLTLNTVQKHMAGATKSSLEFRSVLGDQASLKFDGTVYVAKNCAGADATMHTKNLIIAPTARVEAKPQLEVLTDDVQCAHGCAVAGVDEAQQQYLQSRGLSQGESERLLIDAFLQIDSSKCE